MAAKTQKRRKRKPNIRRVQKKKIWLQSHDLSQQQQLQATEVAAEVWRGAASAVSSSPAKPSSTHILIQNQIASDQEREIVEITERAEEFKTFEESAEYSQVVLSESTVKTEIQKQVDTLEEVCAQRRDDDIFSSLGSLVILSKETAKETRDTEMSSEKERKIESYKGNKSVENITETRKLSNKGLVKDSQRGHVLNFGQGSNLTLNKISYLNLIGLHLFYALTFGIMNFFSIAVFFGLGVIIGHFLYEYLRTVLSAYFSTEKTVEKKNEKEKRKETKKGEKRK